MSPGRRGGLAGGSGYDFQDIFVALQLADLLIGSHASDPLVEVIWEKRGIDWGTGFGAEPVHVNDVVLVRRSGKRTHVEVKESAPSGEWTVKRLIDQGVLVRFWTEWSSKLPDAQSSLTLCLATGSAAQTIALLADVARRARTPAELVGDDASLGVADDLSLLVRALPPEVSEADVLAFLKALEVQQLPSATELESWIQQRFVSAGAGASHLASTLVRLVARSKHVGGSSRTSYTAEALVEALTAEGTLEDTLAGMGVIRLPSSSRELWDRHRALVVERFRQFRVYGLGEEDPVFADLQTLFVPLHLRALRRASQPPRGEREHESSYLEPIASRVDGLDEDGEERQNRRDEWSVPPDALALADVMQTHRRFVVIGAPGSGKTTLLRWLALIAALPGDDGRHARERAGLSPAPLVPVYVRFRQFAERIRERGLHGVDGRAALVADFLAAQFESGLAGTTPGRQEALAVAQDLLDSSSTLLLFDGLDEVSDEAMRGRLFQSVADLLETYEAPSVVVTSRPYAFPLGRSPLNLPLLEPLPLDGGARRSFAKQWYRSVKSATTPELSEAEIDSLANDLAQKAEELQELSETPLLLSILALVHFHRRGMNIDRITLYDHATRAMLGNWEHSPSGRDLGNDPTKPIGASGLSLDELEIRSIVSALAYRIQTDGKVEFARAQAVEILAAELTSRATLNRAGFVDGELVLHRLIETSGLVQETSPEVIAFVHLSFQEYLAARSLAERPDAGIAEAALLAADDRHTEVVRMLAALSAGEHADVERVNRLVEAVGPVNPAVAAACLDDIPGTSLPPSTAESLARALWTEYGGFLGHRHMHPRVTCRLMWTLLGHVTDPDSLLLEFLARGSETRREPGGELAVALLAARPPASVTPPLEWLLRQLSRAPERSESLSFHGIADLLLVESGLIPASDVTESLAMLLDDRGGGWLSWSAPRGRDPRRRARTLLHDLLVNSATELQTKTVLRRLTMDPAPDGEGASRGDIASLLLTVGEPVWEANLGVLIHASIADPKAFDDLRRAIRNRLGELGERDGLVAALRACLEDDEREVRRTAGQLLSEFGLYGSDTSDLPVDADEDERVEHYKLLLADEASAAETLARLTEDLWAEDADLRWCAAKVLSASGHLRVAGLPQALVRGGFASEERFADAVRLLDESRRDDPSLDLAVRSALLDAVAGADAEIAAAAAIHLLGMADASSDVRFGRLLAAGLRDPYRVPALVAYIEQGLSDARMRPVVIKVLGEYFNSGSDPAVVVEISRVLARENCLRVPSLARALALSGLADSTGQQEMGALLRTMLTEQDLVTETREALADALESSTSLVAWGAASCLWEAGNRTERQLPRALARAGLGQPGREEHARTRILELLSHSRLGRRTRIELEDSH